MRLEVPDRDMMSFPLPIALFIYSPSLLGRQLKSNVIGRQQPKWRKTQRRFTVSSEHSCVYVKCIPRPLLLRRKYTSTHRPRGWGTPFASRISSLPPFFLPRMTMCDALSFPSFFFFFLLHLNRSVHLVHHHSPKDSPRSRLWKCESPAFSQGEDSLWSWTAVFFFFLWNLVWLWAGLNAWREAHVWFLSSLTREERKRKTNNVSLKTEKAEQRRAFLAPSFYHILVCEP